MLCCNKGNRSQARVSRHIRSIREGCHESPSGNRLIEAKDAKTNTKNYMAKAHANTTICARTLELVARPLVVWFGGIGEPASNFCLPTKPKAKAFFLARSSNLGPRSFVFGVLFGLGSS